MRNILSAITVIFKVRSTCGLGAEGEKAAAKAIYQSRSTCGLGAKIEKSDPNEE